MPENVINFLLIFIFLKRASGDTSLCAWSRHLHSWLSTTIRYSNKKTKTCVCFLYNMIWILAWTCTAHNTQPRTCSFIGATMLLQPCVLGFFGTTSGPAVQLQSLQLHIESLRDGKSVIFEHVYMCVSVSVYVRFVFSAEWVWKFFPTVL